MSIEQMLLNLPDKAQNGQVTSGQDTSNQSAVLPNIGKNEIDLSGLPDQSDTPESLWNYGIDTALKQARENISLLPDVGKLMFSGQATPRMQGLMEKADKNLQGMVKTFDRYPYEVLTGEITEANFEDSRDMRWADVIKEAYNVDEMTDGYKQQLASELAGSFLNWGTKPSSWITLMAFQKTAKPIFDGIMEGIASKYPDVYKALPKDLFKPTGTKLMNKVSRGEKLTPKEARLLENHVKKLQNTFTKTVMKERKASKVAQQARKDPKLRAKLKAERATPETPMKEDVKMLPAPTEKTSIVSKTPLGNEVTISKSMVIEPVSPVIETTPLEQEGKATGETKVRGLAKGVEAKAIQEKLTEGFGDLPEYKTVNMKDQAEKAQALIKKDPDQAKRIAMGLELPPSDILPESMFVAVENKAISEGDVETLKELGTSSGLTEEATIMGQRIRTLAERNPESPVKAINEVSRVREQRAIKKNNLKDTKKSVKKDVNTIKENVKKISNPKETWADFIKSIQC